MLNLLALRAEMPLDLPALGGIVTAGGAVLAWFGRLERRIGHKLDRKDYSEDRRLDAVDLSARFAELKATLEAQGRTAERARERLFDEMIELGRDMAAVQTELRMPRRRRENPHPRSGD